MIKFHHHIYLLTLILCVLSINFADASCIVSYKIAGKKEIDLTENNNCIQEIKKAQPTDPILSKINSDDLLIAVSANDLNLPQIRTRYIQLSAIDDENDSIIPKKCSMNNYFLYDKAAESSVGPGTVISGSAFLNAKEGKPFYIKLSKNSSWAGKSVFDLYGKVAASNGSDLLDGKDAEISLSKCPLDFSLDGETFITKDKDTYKELSFWNVPMAAKNNAQSIADISNDYQYLESNHFMDYHMSKLNKPAYLPSLETDSDWYINIFPHKCKISTECDIWYRFRNVGN